MDAASKTCFIAMPVTTTRQQAELFGDADHWHHVLEALFVPAVTAAGFEPLRPTARGSHLIHAEIVRQLEQADMVLCDLSHNNPNVFFELGVRTSVNKPVALARCDADTPIPFDVSSINTHTYNPALKPWNIQSEKEALEQHVRAAEDSCAGENPMWRQFGLTLKAQEPTASATKEEAMLEVLARQMSELRDEVAAVRHEPAISAGGDGGVAIIGSGPFSTRDSDHKLVDSVFDLAAVYKQKVNVSLDRTGIVVTYAARVGDPSERKEFQRRVREICISQNISAEFRTER